MTPLLAFSRGDLVLTRFPHTDLSGTSYRPALVISQGQIKQDVVLLGISSVMRGQQAPTDYLIAATHPEFPLTGLRVSSVVRTHKLAAIERQIITRRLGRLGPQMQTEVDKLLRLVLGL